MLEKSVFMEENVVGYYEDSEEADRREIDRVITEQLRQLGMPASIHGFYYLRDAIKITLMQEGMIRNITKTLYPEVARYHHTTASRVERSIRHAIEISWMRGNPAAQIDVFGYTILPDRGKPTNSEFITMMAENIRLSTAKRRRMMAVQY